MTVIEYLQDSFTATITTAVILGLMVGSFLNVVIYRLPRILDREWRSQCRELLEPETTPATDTDEPYNLVVPRSRCPTCNHPISAAQNIPVISYLILKGRCAACGAAIGRRYPIVELFCAIASAAIAWHFGFTWQAAAALLLTWSLIALSAIDIDHHLLPDIITLPLIWAGLALSLGNVFVGPEQAIIGALAGYLSLWSLYHLFKLLTGKEGMGYGDFKLFAAFGAWLGWQPLLLIILIASMLGAAFGLGMILLYGRDRSVPIPFGPYLAVAGWIALLWGNDMIRAYLEMSGLAP